jgi:hypothetical protein
VAQPIEQLAVTFFETLYLAIRSQDGTISMTIGAGTVLQWMWRCTYAGVAVHTRLTDGSFIFENENCILDFVQVNLYIIV